MGLSDAEIQQRASEELAFKLRLERPVAVKSRQLLRQMGRDLAAVYEATGRPLDAREYMDDWVGILKPMYRTAAKGVGDTIRDNIKAYWEPIETKQDGQIDTAIRTFVNTQPVERSGEITETNQKAIDGAIFKTIRDAALEGEELSQAEIGEKAGKQFTNSNLFRGDLIGETEVQNAVEGSKFVELETILALGVVVAGVTVQDRIQREWVTVLDTRTRTTHVRADGQRVEGTTNPFRVGSSRLNYPGDTSLGAEMKEINRCRCGAHTMLLPDQPSAEQVAFR